MRRRSKSLDRLLSSFADTSPTSRSSLLGRLSSIGTLHLKRLPRRQVDRAFHTLAAYLRHDPDEDIRAEIAYILTFWWERRAPWALLAVLDDVRETPRVRGQAAEGVGNVLERCPLAPHERERLSSVLWRSLRDDALDVRFWSLYAVGQLRLTALRPDVEHLRDNDPRLRPGWWRVSDEAADVLTFWDTGRWPDRMTVPLP